MFGFPDIVNHVVDNAAIGHRWNQLRPQTREDVINAARDVLAALGFSEDCSREDVLALGEFVCGVWALSLRGTALVRSAGECSWLPDLRSAHRGPLGKVTHVYEQQMWNKRIERSVEPQSCVSLIYLCRVCLIYSVCRTGSI